MPSARDFDDGVAPILRRRAADAKLSRRAFLLASGLACASTALLPLPTLYPFLTGPQDATPTTAPQEALARLLDGNRRYSAGKSRRPRQGPERRTEAAKGQKPFALIFGCSDSRVPPEIVFDQGLGDLFVVRTAGQVLDAAALGSLEFGVAELSIPLLVVLGHEKCGAVMAAVTAAENQAELSSGLVRLVEAIRPAVEESRQQPGELLDNTVRANVRRGVKQLKASSQLIASEVRAGRLRIVGGRYDLDTGAVEITVP